MIQAQLTGLQNDWDKFLASLSEAKASLDSCLLKWADLDQSLDRIQSWLRDMESQLKDTEPRVDLAEKKALLQKTKVQTPM